MTLPLLVAISQLVDLASYGLVLRAGIPGRELLPWIAAGDPHVTAAKGVAIFAVGAIAFVIRGRCPVLLGLATVGLIGALANLWALT